MAAETYPVLAVIRSPHAAYLLVTSLVGRLPGAMAALAIVQLVRSAGGEFAFAGATTAVYIVAGAVGQPLLGRMVDRFGQTQILAASGVLSFSAFTGTALLLQSEPGAAIALAGVAGLCTPPLEPALRTLWPRLVRPGAQLKAAFSLDAGAQEVIFILGPLLTVAGIAVFGPTGNLIIAGGLGLVGAFAFILNPASRDASGRDDRNIVKSERVRSPILIPTVARTATFTLGIGIPVGALTIVASAFESARAETGIAGWLLAVNAVGALVGATIVGIRPLQAAPARLLPLTGVLLALGYLPLAITSLPTWAYLAAATMSGIMLPPTLSQVFERIAQSSPAAALTEANGWIISAMTLGIGAGTLLAGVVVDAAGASVLPWVVLGASTVTALLSLPSTAGRR